MRQKFKTGGKVLTKYTDLQRIINDMQKQLESLTDGLNKAKQELKELKGWKGTTPKLGDDFYYITGDGRVCFNKFTKGLISKGIIQCHNYFKTKEEGQAELERRIMYSRLQKIADKLNNGEEIDFSNRHQIKYSIAYYNNKFVQYESFEEIRAGVIYCLSPDFLRTAIQDIGEEELKKFTRNKR